MEYCIVPDIHGRGFWKPLRETVDDYDKIIFLGDYVDPYVGYDHVTKEDALYNFIEILDFARNNNDKVELLIGNHDLHYLPGISEEWGCRRDEERYSTIQTLFMENIDTFKLCDIIETNKHGKTLLSHAGININWYRKYLDGLSADEIVAKMNGIIGNPSEINKCVWRLGCSRGGYDRSGSIVWSDLGDHDEESTGKVNEMIGVDYQIFAHTYAYPSPDDIYECQSYSMIDNKRLFFVQ